MPTTIPTLCEVRDTSSRTGHGVFATQKIRRGTIFLSEAPFLQSSTRDCLRAYASLSASCKQKFNALFNSHALTTRQLRCDTVRGIWQSNALPTSGSERAVFETACMVNHTCSPNARLEWDPLAGRMEAMALRTLQVGEEVTACYVDRSAPVDVRRKKLQYWGIVCVCSRCAREAKRAQKGRAK